MKKTLSPQEKKLLSYKKDCRNTYGERGSHSRHAIEAHNNRDRRALRRKANQILGAAQIKNTEDPDNLYTKIKALRRRSWKKGSDQSLRLVVENKLKRRQQMGINQSVKSLLTRSS